MDDPLESGATSQPLLCIDDTAMDITSLTMNSQPFVTGDGKSPESLGQSDSCHTDNVVEKGQLDVKIKKVNVARSNSAIKAGMTCYPMTSNPRGMALIIEIEKYIDDVYEQRQGSHHDVANLEMLWTGLGFEVVKLHNLGRKDFYDKVTEFSRNPKHLNSHMMVLVILSHGRDGRVYAADGSEILIEDIYQKFNNMFCPALKGKPKFFIIQACRGDVLDKAFEVPRDWEDESLGSGRKKKRNRGIDNDANPWVDADSDKARPTWEDMIIAYSTIPGFASIRDHDKGTWFIQSLVEVFSNHAHDKELIDLLRMTSERLSQFTNDYHEKQTCNIEMRGLYKRIYFNPGFFESPPVFPGNGTPTATRLRRSATSPSPRSYRRSLSNPPASPSSQAGRESICDDEELDQQ